MPDDSVPTHQFRYQRWPGLHKTASLISSVAAIAAIAIDERTRPWGIALLVLIAAIYGSTFLRRIAITIDRDGLTVNALGFPKLSWADISAVRFVRSQDVCYLVVDRTDAVRKSRPTSALIRSYAERIKARDLAVPLTRLRDDPRQVCQVIAMALEIARRPRR